MSWVNVHMQPLPSMYHPVTLSSETVGTADTEETAFVRH